jgi:ferritin-like metal-binding protein YciE
MSEICSLEHLLHEKLKDLYDAEMRLIKALPKLAKKATDENLRAALKAHVEETDKQVDRLDHVFELIDDDAEGRTCAGMKGIITEAREHLAEEHGSKALRDVVIIEAVQRIEQYEIAAYTSAITYAKECKLPDIVTCLEDSLAEEKASAAKLAELAGPLAAAAHTAAQADDDDEDEEDDEDEDEDDEDGDDEDDDEVDEDDDEDDDGDKDEKKNDKKDG